MDIRTEVKKHTPHQAQVVVAVSGGIDSIVLLHILNSLKHEYDLSLIVAHVDHGIRSTSARDAAFVSAMAKSYDLPFELHQVTPPKKDDGTFSQNLEQWGRRERYAFFETVRHRYAADLIATAHSADDQIELYLMRLFSKKPFSAMPPFEPRRQLLRPLLSVSKDQIRGYARSHDLKWNEDETNQDNGYLRNRTRNLVLPFLINQYGAELPSHLNELITDETEDSEYFYHVIHQYMVRIANYAFGSKEWKQQVIMILEQEHPAIRWRLCDQIFFESRHRRLGKEAGRRFAGFFLSNAPSLQLPGNVTVKKSGGEVLFIDTVVDP